MNGMRIAGRIGLWAGAFGVAASALAQPVDRPMVEWLIPALTTNKPQTPEEAESGRQVGRQLPAPEVLQPVLDPALPAYQPRKDKLTGSFKGAASDVMVVLVQKWFEK
ncbi:MAG: phosphate ABC transporter substrate-binding protein, PhoT family, partial [Betaproteobacteria bacterium]